MTPTPRRLSERKKYAQVESVPTKERSSAGTVCPHCHMAYDEPVAAPMTKEQAWQVAMDFAAAVDRDMMAGGKIELPAGAHWVTVHVEGDPR